MATIVNILSQLLVLPNFLKSRGRFQHSTNQQNVMLKPFDSLSQVLKEQHILCQ